VDEANKIKEEETDAGLTIATLAGVGAGPEVQVVAASHFGSGSASITGVAKDFRAPCDGIQVSFVDEPRDRSWSKQIVLLQQR
jgi:hypothetical protein